MKFKQIILVSILISALTFISFSQPNDTLIQTPKTQYRITIAGGVAKGIDKADLGCGLIEFGIKHKRWQYSARFNVGMDNFTEAYSYYKEFALMFGWAAQAPKFHVVLDAAVSITAGPSVIIVEPYDGPRQAPTIGLAFAAETRIFNFKYFAIGGYLFGNINAHNTFVGIALMVQTGNLR